MKPRFNKLTLIIIALLTLYLFFCSNVFAFKASIKSSDNTWIEDGAKFRAKMEINVINTAYKFHDYIRFKLTAGDSEIKWESENFREKIFYPGTDVDDNIIIYMNKSEAKTWRDEGIPLCVSIDSGVKKYPFFPGRLYYNEYGQYLEYIQTSLNQVTTHTYVWLTKAHHAKITYGVKEYLGYMYQLYIKVEDIDSSSNQEYI